MPDSVLRALTLADFAGTYRGFVPCDGEEPGLGEAELHIDAAYVTIRAAAPERCWVAEWRTDLFLKDAAECVAEHMHITVDQARHTDAFSPPGGGCRLIFPADVETEGVALIAYGLGECTDPDCGLFFNTQQVARGEFEAAMARIAANFPHGSIPHLPRVC